jgi:hypothetical protein
MKRHKIRSCSKKHLTAEIAENAEKVIMDNLCVLSELCGELKCLPSDQTGRLRPEAVLKPETFLKH